VHKCLHDKKKVCDAFKSYFTIKYSNVNTRRNGTTLIIPKIKLEAARASFYYQGAILFNKLPKHIRIDNDLSSFKKKVKDFYDYIFKYYFNSYGTSNFSFFAYSDILLYCQEISRLPKTAKFFIFAELNFAVGQTFGANIWANKCLSGYFLGILIGA